MRLNKRLSSIAAVGAIALAAITVAPPASATEPLGNKSLAAVLGNDLVPGNGFDKNWNDFDIVREAIDAVIATKGINGTPVGLLADGDVALTAFIPTDRAFQKLVYRVTGVRPTSEAKTFAAVASYGIDFVETVLLYHVIPGATITSDVAVGANGTVLDTALAGAAITVKVKSLNPLDVRLLDLDLNYTNPQLNAGQLDINKGNKQVAHGINRVLRPVDLPQVGL